MKEKTIVIRFLFDLSGSLVGVALAYFAFIIIRELFSITQWEYIVGFIVLLVASGFIIGFFAYKKDGIFLSSFISLVFLIILSIYGIKGTGLYQIIKNYPLTLILNILEGVIFFFIMVLGAFVGGILKPTLWKYSKREIHKLKDASIINKDESKFLQKIYCSACGSEIPIKSSVCIICGKKV